MSKSYAESDLIRIAKRHNNKKRSYLLVNPLQAKHIPVRPKTALTMMHYLGEKLHQNYPDTKLLIAFAETATAIGAAAAKCLGNDCIYLTTTRETYPENSWIDFLEEHSHATEQRLCANHLTEWIRETNNLILLDDELSTGKTLRNMISQLREKIPELSRKNIIAASIINRLSPENERLMEADGVHTEYILKLPQMNLEEKLAINTIEAEESTFSEDDTLLSTISFLNELPNPRLGIRISEYDEACKLWSSFIIQELESAIASAGKILVLGTEECMFPALHLGEEIELKYPEIQVFCHATTRSPIGISDSEGYPIINGNRLKSLYDENRITYIYNLNSYDLVLVLTDAVSPGRPSMECLHAALKQHGSNKIYFIFPEI